MAVTEYSHVESSSSSSCVLFRNWRRSIFVSWEFPAVEGPLEFSVLGPLLAASTEVKSGAGQGIFTSSAKMLQVKLR